MILGAAIFRDALDILSFNLPRTMKSEFLKGVPYIWENLKAIGGCATFLIWKENRS